MATRTTDPIDLQVHISAKPEVVFGFLTDEAKVTRWMGRSARLDPRRGGLYRVDINGRDIARGEFLEVIPNEKVVFSFGWEAEGNPVPPGSTRVEISLQADGEGTLVRLRHLDLPVDEVGSHTQGWGHYLERLTDAAEGRDPGHDPYDQPDSADPSA